MIVPAGVDERGVRLDPRISVHYLLCGRWFDCGVCAYRFE